MKVFPRCLFSIFLVFIINNLYAQTPPSAIKGKVLTENHSSAESSTIVLLKASDSSIVNSTVVDRNGAFQFTDVVPDKYLILSSKIGFEKSYHGPYVVGPRQTLLLRDIVLNLAANHLKEVSVVASRPDIEVKPGKITLNIPSSLTAEGNSAFEILQNAPGVRIENDIISMIGRQPALITIDGKPANLTGDDLAGILKSMQSTNIDRIELITSGSAKYDASGGGIINIVLKKGQAIGTNGTFTATGGYGKYYKASTGIVFNNRTNKFNIFGSYNYSANQTFHNFTTNRNINFNNILSNYDVGYNSVEKSYNSTFSLGTDFFLSHNTTIGFLINGSNIDNNFIKANNLRISNQGVLDSTITTSSDLNRHVTHINYNVNYSEKLDKKGATLSADVNYTTHNRLSAEYITNDFFNASGNTYRPTLLEQNLSPSNIKLVLSKIDFVDPLSKTSKLEAGVKYSKVTSNNDLVFGPQVNGVYQVDPAFSNTFLYTENVNAGYINYENKFDKFNLTAGLRAEQTIAKGVLSTVNNVVDNNYVDFFPQFLLTYKKDSKNDFSLSYNRGIKRPAYEELNPFLYYVDVYDYRAGNPNLKPEYTNSVELSYGYNKTLLTSLYATIVSNAYEFPFYKQNDASKVNITTRENLGAIYNYGARFFTPVVFNNWWNANFRVDASYQRYVAYPQNGNLNKGSQDIAFSTAQYFTISKTITAEINGKYETPFFYGINQFKSDYVVNAAIGKQLFNKKGSLKLNAGDIFNTVRDRSSTKYQNIDLSLTDKKESQVLKLVFTYRFGKSPVKAVGNRKTGNEDEQKRAGGPGANNN